MTTWTNAADDAGRQYEYRKMLADTMPLQTISRPLTWGGTRRPLPQAYVVVVGPIRSQPVGRRDR